MKLSTKKLEYMLRQNLATSIAFFTCFIIILFYIEN